MTDAGVVAQGVRPPSANGPPPASRRILVTGLSTFWGGVLARALERDPDIECVIGVDSRDPTRELERTEFVRVGTQHSLLRRVVLAAEIDTVVDTRLTVDSTTVSPAEAHENNVMGTMNIIAACAGGGSTVRKFVFKSSAHYYGTAQDDPAFFSEEMARPHAPGTPIERDILDAEAAVADFAEKNRDVSVTLLRFANVLGPAVRTSHTRLFSLPVVPMILGFDPRYQFVHEEDVVGALAHAVASDLPGIFNVAGDGVLALSEVASLLGKSYVPLLPPWGTGLAAAVARRLGLEIPPEMLGQLRFGRGLDNRKLKATGFRYRYTSREAVLALGEHLRLHPILREAEEPYQYEREVEEFLRWSPNVRDAAYGRETRLTPRQLVALEKTLSHGADTGRAARRVGAAVDRPDPGQERPRRGSRGAPNDAPSSSRAGRSGTEETPPPGLEHYDDLNASEIIPLLGSLERDQLAALRAHERRSRGRRTVLAAIERALARTSDGSR